MVVFPHHQPIVQQRADDLFHEKRVSLGFVQDQLTHAFRQVFHVQEIGDHRACLLLIQRLQGNVGVAGGKVALRQFVDAPRWFVLSWPEGDNDQQRRTICQRQQRLQQIQRGRVDPVHVIQDQNQRLRLGKPLDQPLYPVENAGPQHRRFHEAYPVSVGSGNGHAKQGGQKRRHLRALLAKQFVQADLDQCISLLIRLSRFKTKPAAQQADEGRERRRGLV